MSTDTEIKVKGLDALSEVLGEVDAERFIALVIRDRFDYTEWQKDLWNDRSIEDISAAATKFSETNKSDRAAD